MRQELRAIGKRVDGLLALFAPNANTAERVIGFFTAQIRNANTRKAYARAAGNFATWCAEHGIKELGQVRPVHVAAYIEGLHKKTPRLRSSSIWPRSGCSSTTWWFPRWSRSTRRAWSGGRSMWSRKARPRYSQPRISLSPAS